MEYLDVYDEHNKKTGKIVVRGEYDSLETGEHIKIVLIFIKNSKNQYLIQKTSVEKGGVWATTGGHVKSGSDSNQTVIEEVQEELGLDISNDNFKLISSHIFKHVIEDIYYLEKEPNIDDLILQKEEVELVKWLSQDDIYKLIEEGTFRKSNIDAFEKILKQ